MIELGNSFPDLFDHSRRERVKLLRTVEPKNSSFTVLLDENLGVGVFSGR